MIRNKLDLIVTRSLFVQRDGLLTPDVSKTCHSER
jgi:hypothetical protein